MNKYITTYADGMDLVHINIWNHPTNKTKIIAKCANHEPVMLIDRKGNQSKVKLTNGKEGWCNTAFLTDEPKDIPKDAESLADVANQSRGFGKMSLLARIFKKNK